MTTTTTTIDKLFADGGASMKAMRFLEIWEIMELPYCIKVRKRMLKLDGKKGDILMNLSVLAQKKDLQKWKEDSRVSYDGQRGGLWKLDLLYKENI